MDTTHKTIIIGAGPAGLTAAYEFLKQESDIHPVVFEETNEIGGISRTVKYNGNRMDIGGHRFFSKDDRVMEWWMNLMPIQGSPSKDDIILKKEKNLSIKGPNPEATDRVMLIRERVSRIFYLRRFFDYPISLKPQTFINMGLARTTTAGIGYLKSSFFKREEKSLEDFMINRFGTALYKMFFEDYTEKVWGVHPSKLSADWGAQRIKSLSLKKAVISAIQSIFSKDNDDLRQKNKETSLIEQFIYPKLGPGQLWETVADEIATMGGEVLKNKKVISINIKDNFVESVTTTSPDGTQETHHADSFISSMPIKDLFMAIKGVEIPKDIYDTAVNLPYRDFMTVGLLVDKLKIKNSTNIKTLGNIVPDTWIYIQERDVRLGRLQIFNNWSPYLLDDPENTVWLGLEYFCNEGDQMWNSSNEDFIKFAMKELEKIDIIDANAVKDSVCIRVKKAYPAYFGSYDNFNMVKDWIDGIKNLYLVGRNGQHRYNNMDHSMLSAMEAVKAIKNRSFDKKNIWDVNSSGEYHETKSN